jgi:hypothetical protein
MAIAAAPVFGGLLAALQAPAQEARPVAAPVVSIERVREGLERPHRMMLPNPEEMAYFRVTVEEELVIDSVLAAMRRDLAARPGRPIAAPATRYTPLGPNAGVDLLALGRSFIKWRAERNARRTVQEALDEFCAAHDCSVLEPGSPTPEGVIGPRTARPSPSTNSPR